MGFDDPKALNQEHTSTRGGKGTNGPSKSARGVQFARNVGGPSPRERYGLRVLIIVCGRKNRLHTNSDGAGRAIRLAKGHR